MLTSGLELLYIIASICCKHIGTHCCWDKGGDIWYQRLNSLVRKEGQCELRTKKVVTNQHSSFKLQMYNNRTVRLYKHGWGMRGCAKSKWGIEELPTDNTRITSRMYST